MLFSFLYFRHFCNFFNKIILPRIIVFLYPPPPKKKGLGLKKVPRDKVTDPKNNIKRKILKFKL